MPFESQYRHTPDPQTSEFHDPNRASGAVAVGGCSSDERASRNRLHSSSQRWRVLSAEPIRWRYWGGEYIVFNPLSGQTHSLDIVSGKVLLMVMSESPSFDRLCMEISAFLDVDNDAKVVVSVSNVLDHLEDAGLIARVR